MRKYRIIKHDGFWYAQKRVWFFFWRSISHKLTVTPFVGSLHKSDVNSRVFKHLLGYSVFRLRTRFDAEQRLRAYIERNERDGSYKLPTLSESVKIK